MERNERNVRGRRLARGCCWEDYIAKELPGEEEGGNSCRAWRGVRPKPTTTATQRVPGAIRGRCSGSEVLPAWKDKVTMGKVHRLLRWGEEEQAGPEASLTGLYRVGSRTGPQPKRGWKRAMTDGKESRYREALSVERGGQSPQTGKMSVLASGMYEAKRSPRIERGAVGCKPINRKFETAKVRKADRDVAKQGCSKSGVKG